MSQSLDEFWRAEDAAKKAEDKVQAIVDNLQNLSGELRNWRQLYLSGAGPIQAALLDNRNPIEATDWPTIAVIHDAMTAHAIALETAKRAWDKVPAAERERVHPPYWARRDGGSGDLD